MDIYKKCFMPGCNNDSNNSPDKIIVKIRENLRKEWCKLANVEFFTFYTMHCCEDHFNPREDLRNYNTFRVTKHRPILKPTAKLRYISVSVNQVSSETQSEQSELAKLLSQDQPTSFKHIKLEPVSTHLIQHELLKNPNYRHGPRDQMMPVHLNFSQLILDKLAQNKHKQLINGATGETISFGDIAQQSINLAVSLSQLGVGKGQTVAICSENRQEFLGAVIGSICTGATFTAFNYMYTEHELVHVANISKPNHIICSPLAYKKHKKTFRSLAHVKYIIVFDEDRPAATTSFDELVSRRVAPEQFRVPDADGTRDTLFVLYSSGTTGLPKGVMLTHMNELIACTAATPTHKNMSVHLVPVPWHHAMGLNVMFMLIVKGYNIVYLPKYDTELVLKCIEKYKVTIMNTVPFMLAALTRHTNKYDVSSLEVIVSGAAPVSKDTLENVKKMFPNVPTVLQAYGMTECGLGVIRHMDLSATGKLGNVGTVASGITIKVLDLETNRPVGHEQTGEIWVKGGIVMKGYVGKDRREDFDEEGFFRTGDVGYYDQDGYFFIVDRLKELIKYKGNQVSPAEIEAVLLEHPGVRDAGVVGVPHADAGEVPRAFVALQPGASVTAKKLQHFVAERLSNPKHLRGGVRFIQEIPKTASGKIQRQKLKTLVQNEDEN